MIRAAYVGLTEITRDFEHPHEQLGGCVRAQRSRPPRATRATASCASSPTASTTTMPAEHPGGRLQLPRAGTASSAWDGAAGLLAVAAACFRSIERVLDPRVVQGVRRTRDLPVGARRGGRLRDRARLRRAVRAAADRGRARRAALVAVDGRGGRSRAPPTGAPTSSTSGWSAPRWSTSRRRARARRRRHGHRLAQPRRVHRDEDRAARRAAGRRRVGPASRCATARCAAEWREATRGAGRGGRRLGRGSSTGCSRSSTRRRSPRLRVVVDAANGMAGVMLPPVLARLPQVDVVRCYFEPDGSFPNHEPNPLLPENREFIVRRRCRRPVPTSESPTTATPTAASSSTTRASSSLATSRRRSSRSRCSRRSRAAR